MYKNIEKKRCNRIKKHSIKKAKQLLCQKTFHIVFMEKKNSK